MTRQETVIKITKITRIIGEMKSQLDLDDEIEFEALDPSWANIGKWTKEIYQYMEQAPSPLLADLITNNEFTTPVVNYVRIGKNNVWRIREVSSIVLSRPWFVTRLQQISG